MSTSEKVNSPSPVCSIVLRAFNEEKHIGRLLSGILEQKVSAVEIILVDSGSTDATLAIASRYPVRVLSILPEEFTFGRSLNIGCSAAQGEFIVLASAHVYPVYPDWLERLLAPFEDEKVALVYGKQRGNRTTRFSEHQIYAKWFPDVSKPHQKIPFCNNANAAIRRSLWQMRPYDEELPGLEDLDWATWAMEEGFHIAYAAEAEIIHVHDETPRAVFNRYRREAMALHRIRPQERFGLADFGTLFISNVISDIWHALNQGEALNKLWEILWFRWMQFWGTYRGFTLAGSLTGELKETFYYPQSLRKRKISREREIQPIEYGIVSEDHSIGDAE
jgi:glycosyltransferase involved in cell wall biosynthesis